MYQLTPREGYNIQEGYYRKQENKVDVLEALKKDVQRMMVHTSFLNEEGRNQLLKLIDNKADEKSPSNTKRKFKTKKELEAFWQNHDKQNGR